jgi:hypothetical protein
MQTITYLTTGAAALLFAGIFLVGGHVHPLRVIIRDRRTIVSFCAGMAMAYVFVHVMPELHGARTSFTASVASDLPFEGTGVYLLALVGFLVFYGLDHLRRHLSEEGAEGEEAQAYRVQLGGFAAYVLMVAYLLVHNLEDTPVSLTLFAVAMSCHFLTIDHSLRDEHGADYVRSGRFVLAGMAVLGWGAGVAFALPTYLVALSVAFISGAVIMNSAIMELPPGKDGRFLPFLAGGLLYGLILLPLG